MDHNNVAIKAIKIQSKRERELGNMEAELMRKVNSKFVMGCLKSFGNSSETLFFIVMPFLTNGNLAEYINNN